MERKPVDRDKTCPFLIRVVWKETDPVTPDCLKKRNDQQEPDEVRLYGWKDMTFREIIDMLKEHLAGARRRDAEFNFSFLRQNLEGGYEIKPVGILHSSRKSELDNSTLSQFRFVIGDFIALTLIYNLS
jgi:Sin3 associated polypeptide p18 (SAP18)